MSGELGGVTGAGPQGGLTAGLAVGGVSGGSASGGTTGPAPATGGTSGAELLAGIASSGAAAGLGGLAGVAPNGGATLLGHLLAGGAVPVHPHLDDTTGGWLDAYAPADHRHPTTASAVWRFSTQTGAGDPGPGYLRCDTGILDMATVLTFSSTTEGGTEFPRVEATLGVGDRLYVQDQNDNSRYQGFDLTGDAVHFSGYSTYPVTPRVGAGGPVNHNQLVAVVFTDADGGGAEGPLDYARLLVAGTAPPAPEAPSDAFWLNPTEEA